MERLGIDHVGRHGDGLVLRRSLGAGGPLYVPYALPGEVVEVEPWPGQLNRRRLVRLAQASPERIDPICRYFGDCGGCALQHWRNESYRAWKRGLVVDAVREIAPESTEVDAECVVGELIDAHGDGRRRVVLHGRVGRGSAAAEVGFSAPHAHRIVPIACCPILAPGLDGVIEVARAITDALRGSNKPLDIQATATDAGMDVDVRGSGPLGPQLSAALARLAQTHGVARITRHGELVAQRLPPTIRIGATVVALPPGAFLQATARGEETLARLVLAHVGPVRSVADLFAGVGPFALRLAGHARVIAADSDAGAVESLRRAAATSRLKPIEVVQRDLFRRPVIAAELAGLDAVVFDPPRQGAEAQARELANSRVPVVVGISCNPTTFARDAKVLIGGGYHLVTVTPIDQFRYSTHVEIVGHFVR
jgi:23S rRNA (uracil1939-C5)-methyltransferase